MSNVAIPNITGRQWPLVALLQINLANITDTAVNVVPVKLPPGAVVIGGFIDVQTAWDTGTSAALNIGDVNNASRYASAVNLKTTGRTALTLSDYIDQGGDDIILVPTYVGTAATVGSMLIMVEYVVLNRANEAQPN